MLPPYHYSSRFQCMKWITAERAQAQIVLKKASLWEPRTMGERKARKLEEFEAFCPYNYRKC